MIAYIYGYPALLILLYCGLFAYSKLRRPR